MSMNTEFKDSLRAHLVELAHDAPRRERIARRRTIGATLAGAALLLGGGAVGWGLSHTDNPDRTVDDENQEFLVHQDFLGSAEVQLPSYPDGMLQVPAVFTCHSTGTLTIAGFEQVDCEPGLEHIFVVELHLEPGSLPVEASDEMMRWSVEMSYDISLSTHDAPTNDPSVLPEDDG